MSVVTDPKVAEALPQLLTEWRAQKRWADMRPQTRSLHHNILESFLRNGHPPDVGDAKQTLLEDLQQRDLIVLDGDAIQHAYPFAAIAMPHEVTIEGVTNFTVCAIDAFGVPAMVGLPGRVRTECANCGGLISVSIGGEGLDLDATEPQEARIWAGIVEITGCAASSQCQSMLGFCGKAHLEEWRGKQIQETVGFSLSAEQALQAGAAIFRPFIQWAAIAA